MADPRTGPASIDRDRESERLSLLSRLFESVTETLDLDGVLIRLARVAQEEFDADNEEIWREFFETPLLPAEDE